MKIKGTGTKQFFLRFVKIFSIRTYCTLLHDFFFNVLGKYSVYLLSFVMNISHHYLLYKIIFPKVCGNYSVSVLQFPQNLLDIRGKYTALTLKCFYTLSSPFLSAIFICLLCIILSDFTFYHPLLQSMLQTLAIDIELYVSYHQYQPVFEDNIIEKKVLFHLGSWSCNIPQPHNGPLQPLRVLGICQFASSVRADTTKCSVSIFMVGQHTIVRHIIQIQDVRG